jgi:hypothetical protein
MGWLGSKKPKTGEKRVVREDSGQTVVVGSIDVTLDADQARVFDAADAAIDQAKREVFETGTGRLTQVATQVRATIAAESENLVRLAVKPRDGSDVAAFLQSVDRFQAARREVQAQRDQEIAKAIDLALATLKAAEEAAAQRLASLQNELAAELRKTLAGVTERSNEELAAQKGLLLEHLDGLVKKVEETEGRTFAETVDQSSQALNQMAELYGQQMELLFTAMAKERMKSIRNASRIDEFEVHKAKAKDPEGSEGG